MKATDFIIEDDNLCDKNITASDVKKFNTSWIYNIINGTIGTILIIIMLYLNIDYKKIILIKSILVGILGFYLQKSVFAEKLPITIYNIFRFTIISIICLILNYIYINQLSKTYYKNETRLLSQKIKNFIILGLISSFVQYFVYYPFVKEWVFCNNFKYNELFKSSIICVILYYIINFIVNYKIKKPENNIL